MEGEAHRALRPPPAGAVHARLHRPASLPRILDGAAEEPGRRGWRPAESVDVRRHDARSWAGTVIGEGRRPCAAVPRRTTGTCSREGERIRQHGVAADPDAVRPAQRAVAHEVLDPIGDPRGGRAFPRERRDDCAGPECAAIGLSEAEARGAAAAVSFLTGTENRRPRSCRGLIALLHDSGQLARGDPPTRRCSTTRSTRPCGRPYRRRSMLRSVHRTATIGDVSVHKGRPGCSSRPSTLLPGVRGPFDPSTGRTHPSCAGSGVRRRDRTFCLGYPAGPGRESGRSRGRCSPPARSPSPNRAPPAPRRGVPHPHHNRRLPWSRL